MNIDDIEKMWGEDAEIDQSEILNEAARIASLHNKYYKILTREKLSLAKMDSEWPDLFKDKYEYYTGTIANETLKKRGWEPFLLKVFKKDAEDRYLPADPDIIEYTLRKSYQTEKISYLEAIVKMINSRGFQINNIIAEKKFNAGVN
jgi:hypothetical protein